MRKNISYFLLIIILSTACTKKTEKDDLITEANTNENTQSVIKMPPLIKLDAKVLSETTSWNSFKNLENEIKKLYDHKNTEDLSTNIEQLILKEKELSTAVFPEKFNSPSVKSRVLVLKTYIFQTQAAIEDKEKEQIIDKQKFKIIEAYNALLKQLNETVEGNLADEFLNKSQE